MNMTPPSLNVVGSRWHWGCLALIAVAIVSMLVTTSRMMMHPGTAPVGPLPTAEVYTATTTATTTPPPTQQPGPTPSGVKEAIEIGNRVRVSGTGTSGLNLRTAPGIASDRVTIAAEGSLFIVAGGPQEVDDLTWWLLKDEINPEREGWGAADYLVIEP